MQNAGPLGHVVAWPGNTLRLLHRRPRSTAGNIRYLVILQMAFTIIEKLFGFLTFKNLSLSQPVLNAVVRFKQAESAAVVAAKRVKQDVPGVPDVPVEATRRRTDGLYA